MDIMHTFVGFFTALLVYLSHFAQIPIYPISSLQFCGSKGGYHERRYSGVSAPTDSELHSQTNAGLTQAEIFLLETARRLRKSKNPEQLLRGPKVFGFQIRTFREAISLSRNEAAQRSGLDCEVWIAIEKGYVPVESLEKLLPNLAQGLHCAETELRQLLTEAIEGEA